MNANNKNTKPEAFHLYLQSTFYINYNFQNKKLIIKRKYRKLFEKTQHKRKVYDYNCRDCKPIANF